MTEKHSFKAVIRNAGGGGAYVEVPFDVEAAFGSKRPKVKAEIEGIAYRGTLMRMGSERHILGILKSIREQCGKDFGDEVNITVEADTEARVVEVPPELEAAFRKEKALREFFDSLAYSHRREMVNSITGAKREETRARRLEHVLARLRAREKGL